MSNAMCVSVYTTVPDEKTAREIAHRLVEERLAACASFFPIESVYRWRGELESAREFAIIMKSTRARYSALESRLRALHPYELPAIVAYDIVVGLPEYLAWIDSGVTET